MGKTTVAIFNLNASKKHSVLYREEGQTGDWQTDPKPKITQSIYVVNSALSNTPAWKLRVTIEEIE